MDFSPWSVNNLRRLLTACLKRSHDHNNGRRRKRSEGPGRVRLVCEPLEVRLAPAGDLVFAQALMNASDSGTNPPLSTVNAAAVAVDGSGNSYVAGKFFGKDTFGPGVTLTALGTDVFLAKYTPAGAIAWVNDFRGAGGYVQPPAIAVDSESDAYLAVATDGALDLAGNPVLKSAGAAVVKLSAQGQLLWAKQLTTGVPEAIAVDEAGAAYVTGWSSSRAFALKLDSTGRTIWTDHLGFQQGESIALSSSGQVFVAGITVRLPKEVDFNRRVGTVTSSAYVSEIGSAGRTVWTDRLGAGAVAYATGVASDGTDVYVTGSFKGSGNFDPHGTHLLVGDNAYVVKLDGYGDLLWADVLGAPAYSEGEAIAVDSQGGVYSTGLFRGTGNFDPGSRVYDLTSFAYPNLGNVVYNVYVSKLDPAGNFVWADRLGAGVVGIAGPSVDGNTYSQNIAVDNLGAVYATGAFSGTGNFDPGSGTAELSSNPPGWASYLVKLTAGTLNDLASALGSGQTAAVGAVFSIGLAVQVTDPSGNPLAGYPVTFSVLSGPHGAGGDFAGSSAVAVTTNDQGLATAPMLTANAAPGNFTVIASATNTAQQVVFSLTNVPGTPTTMRVVGTKSQSVTVVQSVTAPLQVRIVDQFGNPVSGVNVTFSVLANQTNGAGGTFAFGQTSVVVSTNANGIARAPKLTANAKIGTFEVTASVSGIAESATFDLTNVADPPSPRRWWERW